MCGAVYQQRYKERTLYKKNKTMSKVLDGNNSNFQYKLITQQTLTQRSSSCHVECDTALSTVNKTL